MQGIRLYNPTGRKTEARILELPTCELFFSYETCIAVRVWSDRVTSAGDTAMQLIRLRRPNAWGPTTGRHFKELGCADFPCAENGEDFEAQLAKIIACGL